MLFKLLTVMKYTSNQPFRFSNQKREHEAYYCRDIKPTLSSFMTYHRVSNKINMTGATSQVTPEFSGVRVARSLVFCVIFCKSLQRT